MEESTKAWEELDDIKGHKKQFSTDDWWFFDYKQLGLIKNSIDIDKVLDYFVAENIDGDNMEDVQSDDQTTTKKEKSEKAAKQKMDGGKKTRKRKSKSRKIRKKYKRKSSRKKYHKKTKKK